MKKSWTWLPVVGLAVAGGSAIASGGGFDACDRTSQHARISCKRQAESDYWLALGTCDNLPTAGQRLACRQTAKDDRTAAREACDEQFKARQEICRELGDAPYHPVIDPTDFVSVIDNPYFPLTPGTTLIYEGPTDGGLEHQEFFVTHKTRLILGVECVEVRDTVEVNGELIEDTLDWFKQDKEGNVWYLGENAKNLEDGLIKDLAGSWTAGVDGAKPGIVMQAKPQVDDLYRQEFSLGVAEDLAEVLSLNASVVVPWGTFNGCLQTEEFTPQEPGAIEHKYYAPNVGSVLTVDVATGARLELVSVTHE